MVHDMTPTAAAASSPPAAAAEQQQPPPPDSNKLPHDTKAANRRAKVFANTGIYIESQGPALVNFQNADMPDCVCVNVNVKGLVSIKSTRYNWPKIVSPQAHASKSKEEETLRRFFKDQAIEKKTEFVESRTKDHGRLATEWRFTNLAHSEDANKSKPGTKADPVNIYEKCSPKFELIGNFVSARKAANFLGISDWAVKKYMMSGAVYNNRYKFSAK